MSTEAIHIHRAPLVCACSWTVVEIALAPFEACVDTGVYVREFRAKGCRSSRIRRFGLLFSDHMQPAFESVGC